METCFTGFDWDDSVDTDRFIARVPLLALSMPLASCYRCRRCLNASTYTRTTGSIIDITTSGIPMVNDTTIFPELVSGVIVSLCDIEGEDARVSSMSLWCTVHSS